MAVPDQAGEDRSLRKLFPGHYKPSMMEMQRIWRNGIVVLDANVLLNLYRYSPATRNDLMRILRKVQPRLWLPFQAADEFHRNRLTVVAKQCESYHKTRQSLEEMIETLRSPYKHPFVSDELLSRAAATVEELSRELTERQKAHEGLLTSDPILTEVEMLVGSRVGPEPTAEQVSQLRQTATARLQARIPPGFCDSDKDGTRAEGDVFVWIQTLDYARAQKKPAIFVTDDSKEDWWTIVRGKRVGAHPLLVKEFHLATGQSLSMYSVDRFMEAAAEYVNEKAAPSTIEEVRKLAKVSSSRHSSDDGARYLANIAEHAAKHSNHVHEFLEIVGSLSPAAWLQIKDESDLPAATLRRLRECIEGCPCVGELASEAEMVSNPGFEASIGEAEQLLPVRSAELLTELHRIPSAAAAIAARLARHARHEPRELADTHRVAPPQVGRPSEPSR